MSNYKPTVTVLSRDLPEAGGGVPGAVNEIDTIR